MSILVVGVNHRSGPLALLERVTIAPDRLAKAVSGLAQRDNVREAVILSTCNRTEVYVVAELFHGAYGDVRDLLCELGGLGIDELTPHLYSQHDTAAVTHLLEVAEGSTRPCSAKARSSARFVLRGRLPSRRERLVRRSTRCSALLSQPASEHGRRPGSPGERRRSVMPPSR